MAKKHPEKQTVPAASGLAISRWFVFTVILACSFVFYGNILENGIALDDPMVLSENSFVKSGVKGIPDIFSHDSFYGATRKAASQLSWRYRPLSLAVFAIIHEFFGSDWTAYHFFSILLYALSCFAGYIFLRKHVFAADQRYALIASLFFLILPVHTEVVANIKSCDEQMAFLFIILTFDFTLRWVKSSRRSHLFAAGVFYLSAIFSKESSVVMGAMIPVLLLCFTSEKFAAVLRRCIPFLLLTVFFVAVRLCVSSIPEAAGDLPNSPYLLATGLQKPATVLLVLGSYLRLLVFPVPLLFDYGYNHIPYTDFGNPVVWLCVAVYCLLIVAAVVYVRKRDQPGFFLTAYLGGILFVSNLFFDVGPILAERFLYVPGFFLLTAILILIGRYTGKISPSRTYLIPAALLLVSSPFAYSLTVKRNKEWKDNRTLYAADLTKAPESYRIVAFNAMNVTQDAEQATDKVRKDSLFRAAIVLFERAYSIFPDYKMMYMNWGFSYLSLGNPDSAEWAWGRQRVLFPESRYNDYNRELLSKARYDQCMQEYNQHYRDGGNYDYLKSILLKAIKYRPEEAAGWTLLGKVYYLNSQRDSARIVWRKALELDTANVEVRSLLSMQ